MRTIAVVLDKRVVSCFGARSLALLEDRVHRRTTQAQLPLMRLLALVATPPPLVGFLPVSIIVRDKLFGAGVVNVWGDLL